MSEGTYSGFKTMIEERNIHFFGVCGLDVCVSLDGSGSIRKYNNSGYTLRARVSFC